MRIGLALLLLSLSACAIGESTVIYRDGMSEQVAISDGDADTITARVAGRDVVMSRDSIEDIDYPGNDTGGIGLVLIVAGAVNAAAFSDCGDGDEICNLAVLSPIIIGTVMAAEGLSRWNRTRDRAGAHLARKSRRVDGESARMPPLGGEFAPAPSAPRLDKSALPVACHALIQGDGVALVSHVTAAGTDADCALTRIEKSRAPFENEILRVIRFDGKPDSGRLLVRDLAGTEWSSPCVCLAPK